MKATSAALTVGLAAWCSLGTLGVIGDGASAARVALLPPWWLLPALIAAAFSTIRLLRLSASQVGPLFGSTVAIVPWLPIPLPPAALLWTGPFVAALWITVVLGVIIAGERTVRSRWLTEARRAPILAAALALALYAASAWWLSPVLPDGDSPHYLIITQSLIRDGDLRIENNHQRGDDLEYSLFAAEPHFQRRGLDGAIYSIHAPGLSTLIAPAFFLFGYPGAVGFLGLVGAMGTALVWYLARGATDSAGAAWFGWACCALTTPFLFQATQVFPDGIAATFVLLGMLPIISAGVVTKNADFQLKGGVSARGAAMLLLSGASLAVLPWLQTRLAVIAAMIALCIAFHLRTARQFAAFLAAPIVSAAAWFGYFNAIYGTPSPAAPYGAYGENTQTTVANLARGFPGLLFDQQFGLIPNAPVYGFILAGVMAAALRRQRRSCELLIVMTPYMIAVGMFQIWYGGTSAPARLLTPLALLFGVAAAEIWHSTRTPATRAVGLVALVASVVVTAALAGPDRGRLLLNVRDGFALWLEWGNDLLDLPRGVPSLFRDTPGQAWLKAAIWAASVAAGWLALHVIGGQWGRERPLVRLSWLATWCLAVSVMIAFTVVWRLDRHEPLTPATAELGLLRGASWFRPLAFDYQERRIEASPIILSRARVKTDLQRRPAPPDTLFWASRVPAGTYQVHVTSSGPAVGNLVLRVGTTPLPMWSALLADVQSPAVGAPIRLPVDVESILMEVDDAGRRAIKTVAWSPLKPHDLVDRASVAPRGLAHRAVPYGSVQTYFMDDLAYPEPSGFWVAAGRAARMVVANYGTRRDMFLRNTPVDNVVTIDVDDERHEIRLRPREETMIALPRTSRKPDAVVRIQTQNGLRPSQLDPRSPDKRYLGCWVEIR